jgi:hypothetical protein
MKNLSLVKQQNEILRTICQSNIALDTSRSPSKMPVEVNNDDPKVTAAKLFAAINGWEFYPTPEHFSLHGLASQTKCGVCSDRDLLRDPLAFIDQSGRPVAIAEQSYDPEYQTLEIATEPRSQGEHATGILRQHSGPWQKQFRCVHTRPRLREVAS